MSVIPIIGHRPEKESTIRVRRSDDLWIEVKVPRHVSVTLVRRALADYSRGIAPIYLTDAETEFVADLLGAFDAAAEKKAEAAPETAEIPNGGV